MAGHLHVRIDNRLLHGQVVQFWIGHLEIAHLIVADDDMAENEAMPTIYRMALPESVGLSVTPVGRLAEELERAKQLSTMVIIRDVGDLMRALEGGVSIGRVTLGNVHAAPDRGRVTDSVYLSSREIDALMELVKKNVEIEIQTFPGERLRLAMDQGGAARWSRS